MHHISTQFLLLDASRVLIGLTYIHFLTHIYFDTLSSSAVSVPQQVHTMVNNRSSRRKRTRRSQPSSSIRRAVNRISLGMRITPNPDPPAYTADPWWPLTIVDSVSVDTLYTPAKIHGGIISSLSFVTDTTKGVTFKFRVLTVRAWGLDKQPIQMSVTDGTSWVREMNDFGAATIYSRLGWRFGDIFINRVFESKGTDTLFSVSQADKAGKILVYIQVMIKVPNAPDPALVMLRDPLVHDFELMAT